MKFIINKHKIMYTGNGKLFFEITKIIEQSNISKENAISLKILNHVFTQI